MDGCASISGDTRLANSHCDGLRSSGATHCGPNQIDANSSSTCSCSSRVRFVELVPAFLVCSCSTRSALTSSYSCSSCYPPQLIQLVPPFLLVRVDQTRLRIPRLKLPRTRTRCDRLLHHAARPSPPQPLKGGGTASESGPTPYEKLPQIEPAVEVHLELSECRRWLRSTQALIATLDLAQSSVPQRLANQLADLSPKLPGPKGFQHVVPLHVVTSSRLPRPILFLVHPAVSGPSYLLSFLCHPWWLLPAPLHTRLPYGSGASYAVIPAFDSGWYPVAGNPVGGITSSATMQKV